MKRKTQRKFLSCIVAIFLVFSGPLKIACLPSMGDVESIINLLMVDLGIVLNSAIDNLGQEMQDTLEGAIEDLGEVGGELAEQAADLIQEIINETAHLGTSTLHCNVDWAIQRVEEMRHQLFEQYPPPDYEPIICNTIPTFAVNAATGILSYSGFNFVKYVEHKKGTIEANIYMYGVRIMDLPVGINNDNLITVNLSIIDYGDPDLVWNDDPPSDAPVVALHWEEKSRGKIFFELCPTDCLDKDGYDYCVNGCPLVWTSDFAVCIAVCLSQGHTNEGCAGFCVIQHPNWQEPEPGCVTSCNSSCNRFRYHICEAEKINNGKVVCSDICY